LLFFFIYFFIHGRFHGDLNLFPRVYLFHGTADKTVDWHSTEGFAQALQDAGVQNVSVKYYADKTHTDPIIEVKKKKKNPKKQSPTVTSLLHIKIQKLLAYTGSHSRR